MRATWLERRGESLLRRVALLPLSLLAAPYGACARLHAWLYRSGVLRAARFPGWVVSVGSLVVGGTGKTPAAAWIAAALQRRGRRVALASRGYGGRGGDRVQVVSDGRFVRGRVEHAGDEPLLLAAHAPGVPVLVAPDRALAGLRALSVFGADVLVLDDGFQHHRLRRDVDIVTCDGAFGLGNRRILPRGPLREPLLALGRADAIGVVDGPLDPDDEARIERSAPGARRFSARRRTLGLRPLGGGPLASVACLDGADVGLLTGLARPDGFRRTLSRHGARVVAERVFGDHHRYHPRDLRDLDRDAPLWVTTEKDAIKLQRAWVGRADVRALVIELEVDEPEALVDWIESRLR